MLKSDCNRLQMFITRMFFVKDDKFGS